MFCSTWQVFWWLLLIVFPFQPNSNHIWKFFFFRFNVNHQRILINLTCSCRLTLPLSGLVWFLSIHYSWRFCIGSHWFIQLSSVVWVSLRIAQESFQNGSCWDSLENHFRMVCYWFSLNVCIPIIFPLGQKPQA